MKKRILVPGDFVGKLRVVEDTGRRSKQGRIMRFECFCGSFFDIEPGYVNSGNTRSCGCLKSSCLSERNKERSKHGHAAGERTKEYWTWTRIKQRCLNSNDPCFLNYGGKGVTVSKEWIESFQSFLEDVGPCPSDKTEIDRINGHLGYQKGNCRWATTQENSLNRKSTQWITIDGDTKCLKHWLKQLGVPSTTYYNRRKKGMSPIDALIGVS